MAIDLSRFRHTSAERKPVATARRRLRKRYPGYTPLATWRGPLKPILRPGLDIVFVGFNPGLESARRGHHYAHHSNKFYKFAFWSKLTPVLCRPEQDVQFPELFNFGFTDFVPRATRSIADLEPAELRAAAQDLEARVAEVSPRIVCLVGKLIWVTLARASKWNQSAFAYGLDAAHRLGESALCVVPSPSGLNTLSTAEQLAAWEAVSACYRRLCAPADPAQEVAAGED